MKTLVKTLPDGKVKSNLPPKVTSSSHQHLLPEINITPKDLPSKGLSYPKGSEILYHPYTFGEIQKMSQSKLSTKQKLALVMDGIKCSFDKNELTLSDLSYLALLRKISTIGGHKVNVSITCKKCGQPHTEVVDFGTEKSTIEFHDIKAPELPILVTFSNNKEYAFSPLTFKKFVKIIENNQENDTIALIAHQCIDQEYDEVYKLVENAVYDDQIVLEELDKLLEHNIKPISIFCKNAVNNKPCYFENKVELSGGDALLLPFRQPKESISSRIRFGTQAKH